MYEVVVSLVDCTGYSFDQIFIACVWFGVSFVGSTFFLTGFLADFGFSCGGLLRKWLNARRFRKHADRKEDEN